MDVGREETAKHVCKNRRSRDRRRAVYAPGQRGDRSRAPKRLRRSNGVLTHSPDVSYTCVSIPRNLFNDEWFTGKIGFKILTYIVKKLWILFFGERSGIQKNDRFLIDHSPSPRRNKRKEIANSFMKSLLTFGGCQDHVKTIGIVLRRTSVTKHSDPRWRMIPLLGNLIPRFD
mgnify:CR=1 FL=1